MYLTVMRPACLLLSLCLFSVPSSSTEFPGGTAIDIDVYGTLYILDSQSATLRQFPADGAQERVIGGPGWGNNQFDHPGAVWARNGIDVFVADYGNHRVQRFDRTLSFVASFSTRDAENPDIRFGYPAGVALSRLGDLFILDSENDRVVKVNRFSVVERTFGGFDAGRGRLQHARGLCVDADDRVYVLDENRIAVFDTFGNFLHDFLPGVVRAPLCITADDFGVIVLGDTLICWADREGRVGTSDLHGEEGESPIPAVRAIAAGKGSLYLLTSSGVMAIPDPRKTSRNGQELENEKTNR